MFPNAQSVLERLRVVVFSAKNDGGVHFREKYFFCGHTGPQKCPKNGYFEANPLQYVPEYSECARVARYKLVQQFLALKTMVGLILAKTYFWGPTSLFIFVILCSTTYKGLFLLQISAHMSSRILFFYILKVQSLAGHMS